MMRYLAFDPGGTTGIAVMTAEESTRHLHTEQIGEGKYHHQELWDILDHYKPQTVICEDFHHRQVAKADLIPVQYIGVITLWCGLANATLIMQTPSEGKAFWTDDKLKALGLYTKGHPHGNDALRHLLQYITFSEKDRRYLVQLKDKLPS